MAKKFLVVLLLVLAGLLAFNYFNKGGQRKIADTFPDQNLIDDDSGEMQS